MTRSRQDEAMGICTWDGGCKGIKGQERAMTVIVWTGA